jgi:hypothetical protein
MPLEWPCGPVEVSFPQALAHGIYKLAAEAIVDGALAARRTVMLEVVADKRPAGGRPALHYPYSISIESMAPPG